MTLLRHARLVDLRTGRASGPVDVHLAHGVVAGIGAPRGLGDEVVDLEGRFVMPGLWDAHVHVGQWAIQQHQLDVAAASSPQHAAALVAEALPRSPADETLVGTGFRATLWAEAPTAEALDAVSGERPVVLVSADLHSAWTNTAAARRYGVAPGTLRETDAFALTQQVNDVAEHVLDAWVADACRAARAQGLVGLVDMEMSYAPDAWRRRGFQGIRVEAATYPTDLVRTLDASRRWLDHARRLRIGPLKIIVDGSLTTRTAWCHAPYPDGSHGVCTVPPDELVSLMRRAADGGLACAVHAIGDRACTEVLDAFAQTGARGSVEHAQRVRAEDVARFAALGVSASVQPAHLLDDRDAMDRLWPGQVAFPLRALVDAGARLTLGSDAPVAALDPWRAIDAANARTGDDRSPWQPEQALTRREALAASVRASRLAVLGPADFVVLDDDPLSVGRPGVHATYVAGRASAD